MKPGAIREALAEQLQANVRDCKVYPLQPDKIYPPCIYIAPSPDGIFIDPWGTFGGGGQCELFFRLTIVASFVDDLSGFDTLDEFLEILDPDLATLSDRSVFKAIENSKLGGLVDYCHILSVDNYGIRETDGGAVRYIGADLPIVISTYRR